MFHLLLIDVAACAALIMVAAFIMVRRWRRSRRPPPVPARERRRAAGRAGAGPAPHPAAVVPGFSDEGAQPEAGPSLPPGREHAAQPGQAVQRGLAGHP